MSEANKDLGLVTAYGYAVIGGYEGTPEEFCEDLATVKDGATIATQKAEEAAASAVIADEAATRDVPETVDAWLDENVTQETGYVLDRSLTMANAAAPADLVGDLKSSLNVNVDASTLGWELGTLGTDGSEGAATTRIRSDFVPATEGTIVSCSGNPNCLSVNYYDTNKVGCGYSPDWPSTVTVPANVAYIRVVIRKNSWNGQISESEVAEQGARCSVKLKLSKNGILLAYSNEQIKSAIEKADYADDMLENNVFPETTPVNATMTGALVINKTTGVVSSTGSSYWCVSDSITVNVGEEYILNCYMSYDNGVVGLYDSNGDNVVVIPASQGTTVSSNLYRFVDYRITIPTGVTTMRIGAHITSDHPFSITKFVKYRVGELKFAGKKWAMFGDSLTEINSRTTYHYFDYIADKTGIVPVNLANSGTGYRNEAGASKAFYQVISNVPTDSDVVTIFGSFNDGLTDLGTASDTGTTTVGGCINTTLDNLYAVMPVVQLGIIAPTPWVGANPYNHSEANAYVELLEAICKKRSIPFLNLYYESNLRPWDSTFRELAYSKDNGNGVHPDETGHALIAPRIEGFLDSLLLS